MQKFKDHRKVKVIHRKKCGNAAALNHEVRKSKGEFLFFVDGDGVFTRRTIAEMLKQFYSPNVGGVCGNRGNHNLRPPPDQAAVPANPCRDGLCAAGSFRNQLPANHFRKHRPVPPGSALMKTVEIRGGEPASRKKMANGLPIYPGLSWKDLSAKTSELTWRIHRAGYPVNFAPHALVMAEVPSTIKGLWKQRVRWAHSFLQTVRIHKGMFFNPNVGPIGLYLPINYFNQVVNPILQLILLVALFSILFLAGANPDPTGYL